MFEKNLISAKIERYIYIYIYLVKKSQVVMLQYICYGCIDKQVYFHFDWLLLFTGPGVLTQAFFNSGVQHILGCESLDQFMPYLSVSTYILCCYLMSHNIVSWSIFTKQKCIMKLIAFIVLILIVDASLILYNIFAF